jgi:pimeloyl-ACP methyl ester carboxylesterase
MTPHDYLELPFRELPVSGGRIRYRRAGTGTPVLFVHGVFVNSDLWRGVVPQLVDDFDCIALDLPLGSHGLPMGSGADLSPDGLVAILVEVIEALGLAPVRIVANDSGGALTQVLTSRHPHLVHSIVLTSCDAYDYFFPPLFRTLPVAARVPGALRVLSQALRVPWVRRLPLAYGWVTRRPMPSQTEESYLRPMRESAAVRRDLSKVLRDVRSSYTLTAAEKLRSYPGRVLLVWGEFDKVFPLRHARQLAQDLPHADLVTLPDTGAFVPEDAPDDLARLIRGFFRDSDATPTD